MIGPNTTIQVLNAVEIEEIPIKSVGIQRRFCAIEVALSRAKKEQTRPASHMKDLTQFILPHSDATFLSVSVSGS